MKNLISYPFCHWKLSDIPYGSKVAVYGCGEIGKIFLEEIIKDKRADIIVCFYLDSFNSGEFLGYQVKKYSNEITYNVDYIIIASMFWPNIMACAPDNNKFIIYTYDHNNFKLSIVDHEKKLIFRRNARTGSKDIEDIMLNTGAKQQIIDINDPQYNNYFSFSFVRHPTSKFLSGYQWYVVETLKMDHSKVHAIDIMPIFKAMNLETSPPSLEQFLDTYMQLEQSMRDFHFWGQHKHLGSDLDFIGKLENISSDIKELNLQTGAFEGVDQEHTAKKKIADYQNSISAKNLKSIESIFKEDYIKFNY